MKPPYKHPLHFSGGLSKEQRRDLEACGPDAQEHPVEIVDGELRFVANPAIAHLNRTRHINLSNVYLALDMNVAAHRLGLREFYRMLGYSINGYLEMFEEMLRLEQNGRLK